MLDSFRGDADLTTLIGESKVGPKSIALSFAHVSTVSEFIPRIFGLILSADFYWDNITWRRFFFFSHADVIAIYVCHYPNFAKSSKYIYVCNKRFVVSISIIIISRTRGNEILND